MEQPVPELLAGWESFYVIAGSVAGALIGLQFVVMALIADSPRRTTPPEIAVFGTPTVLHFSAALLLSALLSAPWTSPSALQFILGACGGAGVIYVMIIIRRARRPNQYQPVLEDWVWHAVLPLVAYLALALAAALFSHEIMAALAIVAAVALGLVFIGIRNAWDTITYVATGAEQAPEATRAAGRRKHR